MAREGKTVPDRPGLRAYTHLAAYVSALEAALGHALAADDYLFVRHASNSERWPRNIPIHGNTLSEMLTRRTVSVIGRRIRPHWVRHGAAHALHEATKDVVKVQEFLGHSSLATTGIYLQSLTDTRGDDGDLLGERVEP